MQPPVESVQPRAPHGPRITFLDDKPGPQRANQRRQWRLHATLHNELVTIEHSPPGSAN
jgi:hypothetical protein